MGLPNIQIIFKTLGISAIQRGERGVVALILKDVVPSTNPIVMDGVEDIPATLSAANKEQIQLAFMGYVNPPKRVIAYILDTEATSYADAQNYLETIKFNYLAVPDIAPADTAAFATWVKSCRDTKDLRFKAVLPHTAPDHEGIINFDTDDILTADGTYTAAQYCSRIAGMLAGTPLYMSATFAPLPEVLDVPHHTKTEFDALIDAGKLVLMNDGEKVKIARAVNSLVTTTQDKGADFKKIKIVDIMDQIHDDIKTTANDNYVGKYANNYDNKCLLITAINAYLDELANQNLLERGRNSVAIDVEANRIYLESHGIDTSTMKEQDIKEANTDANVFLTGTLSILDAMEDITLTLYV